jgi:branched-chain amino acid transport system ATP-binding protein
MTRRETSAAPLECRGVSVCFGAVTALDHVDMALRPREIQGLIGPNGAGKTTLVNVLTGFQRPTAGRVKIGDRDVTGLAPHKVSRLGISRTFQGARLFRGFTVHQNVLAGAVSAGAGRRTAGAVAWELLERLALVEYGHLPARSLPHGIERRVAIARALASQPRFLLLDEPAAGLNEVESDHLARTLADVRDDLCLTLLVIEHDMRVIMSLCERIHVLDHGRTIAAGSPAEIRDDAGVVSAYLGVAAEGDARDR